jgi:hypothetical protein
MKKFVIILVIVLVSGLTAFSLTRNPNKAEAVKMNSDKAAIENVHVTSSANLATAD